MEYTIKLTENCNMNCSFCLQEHKEKNLSIENIKTFLDTMDKDGVTDLKLYGGEPLLRKKEIDFISKHKNAKNYSVRVLSNLLLLDEEYLSIFLRFGEVIFITNLEIFQPKNFFNSEKWKKVLMLKNSSFTIQTHALLDKKEVKRIHIYKDRILKHKRELEDLKTIFDLEYPSFIDYSPEDFVNIFSFYDEMKDNDFDIFADTEFCFHDIFYQQGEKNTACVLNAEKAIDVNGNIKPCTCFMGWEKYSEEKVKEIEEDSKKCDECILKNHCRSCKYNYMGTNNRLLKCKRKEVQLKAIYMYLIDKDRYLYKTKKYNMDMSLGNQCNKNCSFCFQNKNDKSQSDPKIIEKFLSNNYGKIGEIGKIIGGEPTLILNDKWKFLFDYIDEDIWITTNGYLKNNFILENDFKLFISIHKLEDLKNIQWEFYRSKIRMIGVMLSKENLKNIDKIAFFLQKEFPKTPIRFQEIQTSVEEKEIFIPEKKDIEKLIKTLKIFPELLRDFRVIRNQEVKKDCFEKQLNVEKDKLTLCSSMYELSEITGDNIEEVIITKDLENYIIDEKEIEKKVNKIKEKYPNIQYDCIAKQNYYYAENKIYEMIREEFKL